MQIVEVSELGVRVAIIRLVSPRATLEWLMFPMIHLAERGFYQAVETRMESCDLVLAEGIDSSIVEALTASYRLSGGRRDLQVQPDPRDAIKTRNADLPADEFDAAWARMPAGLRIAIPLLAPAYGLWLRYLVNPNDWQRDLETNDLSTNDEVIMEAALPEFFDAMVNQRHRHLFEQIEDVQREWGGEVRKVGVAWGARHIGAVVHYLGQQWGYVARSADWVTAFDHTKPAGA